MENSTKTEPLAYTVSEVSQTLRIGKALVYRLIRSERLKKPSCGE